MNWTKIISGLTAVFVFFLTAVSIVLTYNALYDVAYDNGLTGSIGGLGLAYIWPLTIDGALLVFSLAVINASLSKDSTILRWVMVGIFTLLTIAFNFVDGGTDRLPDIVGSSLPFIVRTVPPVALVLSFETLMSMLRKSVKRDSIVKSMDTIEAEWDIEKDKINTERGQLASELDNLNKTITTAKQTIQRLKSEEKQTTPETMFKYLPDNLLPDARQQMVYKMSNDGVTIGQQAAWLNVSEGTIKNDRKALPAGNRNGNGG